MNTFVKFPLKYVKIHRRVPEGRASGVQYEYLFPEVQAFLADNEMTNRTLIRADLLTGVWGVEFFDDIDAVLFKLAFL